ncbi:MAG TPA: glutathione S-transferase N-terminal domain-containing protein [Rhodanobacteraceae bacterium]|nr:glutathione S-transferase N-terminal domain-containing protein [Rhodanobacteraceae bacterium]
MIELYYWPTPNGQKIALFLEEAGLEYEIRPVNINKGDQFKPDYLAISPNNKMPAIVDRAPADGGAPISVFESGAILLYLADKTRQLIPADIRGRVMAMQWLFWQVGGLGPMVGQSHHFNRFAPEKIPYAIERYVREMRRLFGVLDKHLEGRDFICGTDYTIADIASYPWIASREAQEVAVAEFSNLERWSASIRARPATQRVYARGEKINPPGQKMTDEARRFLFGQGAGR